MPGPYRRAGPRSLTAGDVEGDEVHGDAAYERPNSAFEPAITARPQGAQDAVGETGGQNRNVQGFSGGEGRAIADGLVRAHGADLQDRRLQGRDGTDFRVARLERAAADEADAGAGEVVAEPRPEEAAGGVGEAGPGVREQAPHVVEGVGLGGVQGVIGRPAAGEVADHQTYPRSYPL
jgi:hypothetical protein